MKKLVRRARKFDEPFYGFIAGIVKIMRRIAREMIYFIKLYMSYIYAVYNGDRRNLVAIQNRCTSSLSLIEEICLFSDVTYPTFN